MPNIDGVKTLKHETTDAWWECDDCFARGLTTTSTVDAVRKAAHKHTAASGHETRAHVEKAFTYVKEEAAS